MSTTASENQTPDTSSKKRQSRLPLTGKTTLVTGAGRGIGREIAIAFAQAGSDVACVSRTRQEVEDVVAFITQTCPSKAMFFVGDISDIDGVPTLIRLIEEWNEKPIDVLINNAGIATIGALEFQEDMRLWQKVMQTNLLGPVALIRKLLPGMLSRATGTIISIGSRNAFIDIPYMTAYSTSKAALLRFHRCLECEICGRGVYSYYVQPGNIESTILNGPEVIDKTSFIKLPDVRQVVDDISNSTKKSPEEVARACVMLVEKQDARLLSGLYINLDKDISKVLNDLHKGAESEVFKRGLYKLKVEEL